METQVITIPVQTDMDPSQLLSIAQEIAERLRDEIESYGEEAEVDEDEVCVSGE
jgi:small-conductance mechanosensitive channel